MVADRAREAQQRRAAEDERAREEEEGWNGRHLEAAAAGTSGDPREVVLYIPPQHRAEKLTFIALARTLKIQRASE